MVQDFIPTRYHCDIGRPYSHSGEYLIMQSRRGLLKALGLGSVGLVASGSVAKQLIAGSPEAQKFVKEIDRQLESTWEHPAMDKIQALLSLTGGYPNMFATFPGGDTIVQVGDVLNLNYEINDSYLIEPITLYRVYNVEKACIVMGVSIQGPVVRTQDGGHRLATLDELVPDEEASVKNNVHSLLR